MHTQEVCKHIVVTGKVQGVGFRYYTKKFADAFKLEGWTRNLSSGEVEILAKGDLPCVLNFLQKISYGPSFSRVDSTKVMDIELFTGNLNNLYEIKPDGDQLWA
ncbi:MAG: acylphosphatase [Bdellovibrionaceae bacterium]|jgi:acylphosphatase|nr:acylphosphatase [Pseudobdellovibrionaceae bacterium]